MNVYKHIVIKHDSEGLFKIINKHSKSDIALIEYYAKWNKWVLSPYDQIIFDISCLEDIIGFMKTLE